MRNALIAVVSAVVVGIAGCSSGSSPEPTPSTPSSTTASPSATASPTESPPPTPIVPTKGSAQIRVTGDLKANLTLPLGPNAAYQGPPGTLALSYINREGNALIVGGDTPTGTVRTSSRLTLSLVVQTNVARAFPSSQGECSITVTAETAVRFAATFRCRNLTRKGKTIRATGSFSAKR